MVSEDKKHEAREAIDRLKPKMARINQVITEVEQARTELGEYDSGEFEEAMHILDDVRLAIQDDINASKSVLDG